MSHFLTGLVILGVFVPPIASSGLDSKTSLSERRGKGLSNRFPAGAGAELRCREVMKRADSGVLHENADSELQVTLPDLDPLLASGSAADRLSQVCSGPSQILQSKAGKDVVVIDVNNVKTIAKIYKQATLAKMQREIRRDFMMAKVLQNFGFEVQPIESVEGFIERGIVLQKYEENLVNLGDTASNPELSDAWVGVMKQIRAVEKDPLFLKIQNQIYKNYGKGEIDFRADNLAITRSEADGRILIRFIDW